MFELDIKFIPGIVVGIVIILGGLALVALPLRVVEAQSVSDLQAQIDILLQRVQELQSQLKETQTNLSKQGDNLQIIRLDFTRDLTVGSRGEDVLSLQKFLNLRGFSIAASGPGSQGNETMYFGELTRRALARFQSAQSISPSAGYFGTITRNRIEVSGVPQNTDKNIESKPIHVSQLPEYSYSNDSFRKTPNGWPDWLLKEREQNYVDVLEMEEQRKKVGWNSMQNDNLPLLIEWSKEHGIKLIGTRLTSSEILNFKPVTEDTISLTIIPGIDIVYEELKTFPQNLMDLIKGTTIYLSNQYGESRTWIEYDKASNRSQSFLVQTVPPDEITHELAHVLDFLSISVIESNEHTIGKTKEEVDSLREEFRRVFSIPDKIPEVPLGVPIPGYIIGYSTSNITENFATHFDFYIHSGPERFRERAVGEPFLKEKYDFLKNKIFSGVEYCAVYSPYILKTAPCNP